MEFIFCINMALNCGVKQIKKVKTKYRWFRIKHSGKSDLRNVLIPQHSYIFCGVVNLQNCLFMNQIEQNEKLAESFSELKYRGYNHNYQTRSVTRKLLNIPYVKTDAYWTQSAKYHCIIDLNNFKKTLSNLSSAEHRNPKIKALLKNTFGTPSKTIIF